MKYFSHPQAPAYAKFNFQHQNIKIHDLDGLETTSTLRKNQGQFLGPQTKITE